MLSSSYLSFAASHARIAPILYRGKTLELDSRCKGLKLEISLTDDVLIPVLTNKTG